MQKIITVATQSERLDVLVASVADISRTQSAKWIADGLCTVNGKAVSKAGYALHENDEVIIAPPEAVETEVVAENLPLDILYQDADIAVVVKPYGMVVHPAAGNESGTLVNALLYHMKDLSGIGGVKRPGIVHRLDKDTSGLLMIAKNDQAHMGLSDQLSNRTMVKRYLAVVEGNFKDDEGEVVTPIARSKKDRKKMAIDPTGRPSHTKWCVLERLKQATLLSVHILTGRTHQIRVHMQSVHHPVAGDSIYGAKTGVKAPRLMLHAYSLGFHHPITGEWLTFTCPPPSDFVTAVTKLREDPKEPLPF